MNIPAPVLKVAHKATNWIVKNGPKIASVGGGLMAVGGAVMACNATLRVDAVLDAHKERMSRIEAAKAISDENGDGEITEKDVKRAKFEAYRDTTFELIKLYGPAFAVGMSGVGLMQAAFIVTERRRASAIAALTTVDQMYQNLLASSNEEIDITNAPSTIVADAVEMDEDDPESSIILAPENVPDPFFFIFDIDNRSFQNTYGNKRAEFLTNERFILSAIENYNYRLSGHVVDHVWLNDILKAWGMEESEFGQHYGWNGNTGDQIEYKIVPFVKQWNDEGDKQFPLLVQISREEFEELEASDIQEGYCIGIRLLSSSDGHDDICDPRFIYNEVYGK
jgi:hypothetical protein